MATKRKWVGYVRSEPDYANWLRRVVPTASLAVRKAIQAADQRHAELRIHDTSCLFVEETLHLKAGGTTTIKFYHPVKLMQYVLDHAPELARHYFEIATLLGDRHVWKLMLGFDEQTPGSKVNHENKRKNMVCIMNFVDVGHDCLEMDNSWFVPVILRANFSRTVRGGWSAILRRLLLRLLTGVESISTSGLLIRGVFHGQPRVVQIKAELEMILTDGEGLQYALEWNGPSSLRPTFNIANVYMLGSRLDGDGYVDISCSDWAQFRQWATAEVLAVIDGILAERGNFEHGVISATRLKEHIKSAGFCVTKDGLLADLVLREIFNFHEVFRYDFMHTAFQDGFMSNAMWLMCKSVFEVKYGRSNDATPLLSFLRELQFPQSRADGRRLHNLFSEKLMPKHAARKCLVANASMQLSLYKVLEYWAAEEAADCPALLEHCAVYAAACKVVDIYIAVKHRRQDAATAKHKLVVLIGNWQDLHKMMYGVVHFKPKFVWLWCIAFNLGQWWFDMFYVERQHKRVKRQIEPVQNTRQFEGTVLQRVLDDQVLRKKKNKTHKQNLKYKTKTKQHNNKNKTEIRCQRSRHST